LEAHRAGEAESINPKEIAVRLVDFTRRAEVSRILIVPLTT
jgi:hypothetical protein